MSMPLLEPGAAPRPSAAAPTAPSPDQPAEQPQAKPPLASTPASPEADQPTPAADAAPSQAEQKIEKFSSSIRIKKSLSLKNKQPEPNQQQHAPADAEFPGENRPAADFSNEKFLKVWKSLAESLKEESPSLHQAMTQYEPVVSENYQVLVQLDNSILEHTMQERKSELLGQLRRELNNYSVQLDFRVNKLVVEQRAYLPAEKFKKLSEKNPLLLQLQKDLDLDFLY